MKLPNRAQAFIRYAKLTDYLLSETHLVGRSKAKFFRDLGFNEDNVFLLEQALLAIAYSQEVTETLSTISQSIKVEEAMIKELDVVTLTRDFQQHRLLKGSQGAVVHCYSDGQGYKVEFTSQSGEAIAVLTLERADIRLERETIHAQVLNILDSLPKDLLAEIRDFAEFLQQRKAG